MSQATTQDYLDAIQAAKENGHAVDIDFGTLPKGVDSKAIASAMSDGLSDAHGTALQDAADNGHQASLDFAVAHPIMDAVEKTAELGGMAAGGMAGAGAGALTSPVTGPVGPVVGAVGGAGLGYGAVKSGADALNQSMGLVPPKSLADNVSDTASDVGEGMKMQAFGETGYAAVKGGVEAAKTAYPIVSKLLTKLPPSVSKMFMENPNLPKEYSGHEKDVNAAVEVLQHSLEHLHDQASEMYARTMDNLGLSGPQTPDESAQSLMEGGAKSVDAKTIGTKWLDYQTAPNLSDNEKLQRLSEINQDINSHLKWAKAGQSLDPISSRLTPHLQVIKNGVKAALDQVSGGEALKKADEGWHAFRQLYNSLQPNLKDTGEATKWLTNIISDSSAASNTPKTILKALDAAVGSPVADTAQKQIASSMLKKPMADSMLGKMALVMSMAHPARLLTLPPVIAAQSPAIQTKGMQMLMGLKNIPHEMIGPGLMGAKQGSDSLPKPSPSDDVQDLVNNAQQ